jgi:hypothetical protein
MAIITPTPTTEGIPSAPETPRKRHRRVVTRAALTWAAILVAGVLAAALAAVTLLGGDATAPTGGAHTEIVEHGSIRAIEGSVEETVDPAATGVHTGLVEHGSIRAIEGSVEGPGPGTTNGVPSNYYPHGFDYGEADDASAEEFVPGSRHMPSR